MAHQPQPESCARPPESVALPVRLGRYRILARLGAGGFGVVYRGRDEELRRDVAIKVARRYHLARAEDAEAYLAEARILAAFDHPGIVPVYDVGRTEDGHCYLVSKFIEGRDLTARLQEGRPAPAEAAEFIALVAAALHHAHERGLTHCDVKPANILLDSQGRPVVVDFGLALSAGDFRKGAGLAGTPAYMSPEQARGEGHRVDARTDVYSLGVVLYELLTGRRPFGGASVGEILELVKTQEPPPLRQLDATLPRELERICLKCLAKRSADRYPTARHLAEDLHHWLTGAAGPPAANAALRIVPKGLRSFDAADAAFFLELLPGARDRDGLPESVRFWKSRIEATTTDHTFPVGLLYGPSGCGKSSLVKAGLLPRLAAHIVPIYVEATADETEARLLTGLRRHLRELDAETSLAEILAQLRRGHGLPAGQKVLVVLDQFEQWLHAHHRTDQTELIQALRQCDGERVQALVLVRDDFWMAATRFLYDLEFPLEARNSAAVDLFDLRHARKVLTAIGVAFGTLPPTDLSPEQTRFVEQAVAGLAQDDKVISVRLALFAEMMKSRPWTPAALREVGGTAGVGVTFLEETFSAATAPPEHRYHQHAARAVLQALLPEEGTDIKGQTRPQAELQARAGHADRPRDWERLLRILDSELRLVTPIDPEASRDAELTEGPYYQLTHDYLVPTLREWLTRKQRETRRGRAELCLAQRAAAWAARPESRQLPSWWESLCIAALTRKRGWTAPQRQMMARAARKHGLTFAALIILVLLLSWSSWETVGSLRGEALVRALAVADTTDVPKLLDEVERYRRWTEPRVAALGARADDDSKESLHAALARHRLAGDQADYLAERVLTARPEELLVLRDALGGQGPERAVRFWQVLQDRHSDPGRRLRAACALASLDRDGAAWAAYDADVAAILVQENVLFAGKWAEALRPVRLRLVPALTAVFRDPARPEAERSLATGFLAAYAADRPAVLADLLADADAKAFAVLFPLLAAQREPAIALLERELDLPAGTKLDEAPKERQAQRQANAAVALLRLQRPGRVWPLLQHRPDPRLRTHLVQRLGAFGADARHFAQRLMTEADVSVRRALLLCLGEPGPAALPAAERQALLPTLLQLYREDPDPGIHGAAAWLLRQWGEEARLAEIEQPLRERDRGSARAGKIADRHWYVNGQGQTMVIIPGPVEFVMGSPPGEAARADDPEGKVEPQQRRLIGRSFAIAAHEVTVAQFLRSRPGHEYHQPYSPTPGHPVNMVTWYEAAEYCNWLSQQEGIPEEQWCYLPNDKGQFADGMRLRPDALNLSGYRLPTEAEWEYACRAGAVTSRFFGESEEQLGRYVWFTRNSHDKSMSPPGRLRPNDLGMFDMLGNAMEWCHDGMLHDQTGFCSEAAEHIEREELKGISDRFHRVLRGGSFVNRAVYLRSAYRNCNVPSLRNAFPGLRPARTCR